GGLVRNGGHAAAYFLPTLEICGRVAVQLGRSGEKVDMHSSRCLLQMARSHKSIPAVVSFSAEHANTARHPAELRGAFQIMLTKDFGQASACCFHEFEAGNAEALSGQAVNFAHLRCGKSFHRIRRSTASSRR